MKSTLRKDSTRAQWLVGLKVLDGLWKSGYLPNDLKAHYYLTWFALNDGYILSMVNDLGLHRNTYQVFRSEYRLKGPSTQLRYYWQNLSEGLHPVPFETRFLKLYKHVFPKQKLNTKQNNKLIGLWKTGFPFKILRSHFLLWGTRSGKDREWLYKKTDLSKRQLFRCLKNIVTPKRPEHFWLSPLAPKATEFYRERYFTRLKKRKDVI